jgi:Domain of unknown function (DUF4292)
MHHRTVLILFASFVLLQACSRKTTPSTAPASKTLAIEEIDFEYLHGKARLNYKDDKKEKEVKATIRIHKDSVIWMTLSLVGIPGARALINKDSVTVMSLVDKEYYVFDYKSLSKRFNFNIDFNVIQSAMLGNLILPLTDQDKIQEKTGFNQLDQFEGSVMISNFINSTTKKLERLELTEDASKNSLKIEYANFQPVGTKTFPYKGVVNIFYHTAAGIINNSITIEYTKVEVGDKELRFPFKIPNRYERR